MNVFFPYGNPPDFGGTRVVCPSRLSVATWQPESCVKWIVSDEINIFSIFRARFAWNSYLFIYSSPAQTRYEAGPYLIVFVNRTWTEASLGG